MNDLVKKIKKVDIKKLLKTDSETIVNLIFISLAIFLIQTIYLNLRFDLLKNPIPLWYTKPWGIPQLADKKNIFQIPLITFFISSVGVLFSLYCNKKFVRYGEKIIFAIVTFANLTLTYSLLRIILISAVPEKPLINPNVLTLLIPFLVAFVLAYFATSYFIKIAKEKELVTNPNNHFHPAMILKKPSARGGGLVFAAIFVLISLFFVPLNLEMAGILVVSLLIAILGILDDYQNTHKNSKLKFLETPFLRLGILFCVTSLIILFGVRIESINNPFDGAFELTNFTVVIRGTTINLVTIFLTVIWIVWVLNLLSWSNGVDGQYSGIIGIAGIVLAILALRFDPILPVHKSYAKLAIITAGASFGLLPYTWHPSKIMWGFGAMAAGLSLATISIGISSKITTSMMIILIPFLDAAVTVGRRLLQGKNPLKGDQGHLHHLLLERGWNPQRIAVFYWVTTAIFGVIAILFAEKLTAQTVLTFVGIIAFFIILMNVISIKNKRGLQETE